MEESNNEIEPPDEEDVLKAIEDGELLKKDIENYREEAEGIDSRFLSSNEHRTPGLDEMPYGEELIRTEDLPTVLDTAIADLTSIANGSIKGTAAATAYANSLQAIEYSKGTFEDCTPIRSEDDLDRD